MKEKYYKYNLFKKNYTFFKNNIFESFITSDNEVSKDSIVEQEVSEDSVIDDEVVSKVVGEEGDDEDGVVGGEEGDDEDGVVGGEEGEEGDDEDGDDEDGEEGEEGDDEDGVDDGEEGEEGGEEGEEGDDEDGVDDGEEDGEEDDSDGEEDEGESDDGEEDDDASIKKPETINRVILSKNINDNNKQIYDYTIKEFYNNFINSTVEITKSIKDSMSNSNLTQAELKPSLIDVLLNKKNLINVGIMLILISIFLSPLLL